MDAGRLEGCGGNISGIDGGGEAEVEDRMDR